MLRLSAKPVLIVMKTLAYLHTKDRTAKFSARFTKLATSMTTNAYRQCTTFDTTNRCIYIYTLNRV